MDPILPSPATSRNRLARKFRNVINLKTAKKTGSNPGFYLLIPQEKLRCFESHQFEKEDGEEAKEDSRNRAAMDAFVAKLFATISAVKAAYAELQMAQFPYNIEAVRSADQTVVDDLKALSELKREFLKKQFDFSPSHVTLLLAEIQEQQSLMKTCEITMKKMRGEIDNKEALISTIEQQLRDIIQKNKTLEKMLNASGSFSILDNVKFSEVSPKDFILVLHYALRSVRSFVKFLIRGMESANWDIEAAANAIQYVLILSKRDHKAFIFESFVCSEIFAGFNDPCFSVQENYQFLPEEIHQRRIFLFKEFKRIRSVSVFHLLRQNPNSLFGKFLKYKYLHLVHPKMELSFSGNLNQRKMVNSGENTQKLNSSKCLLKCGGGFGFHTVWHFRLAKKSAPFKSNRVPNSPKSIWKVLTKTFLRRRTVIWWSRSPWFRGSRLDTRWCKARCTYLRQRLRLNPCLRHVQQQPQFPH